MFLSVFSTDISIGYKTSNLVILSLLCYFITYSIHSLKNILSKHTFIYIYIIKVKDTKKMIFIEFQKLTFLRNIYKYSLVNLYFYT